MIDHLLFNKAFWIQKTTQVQNKLDNYDNLQKFHDNVMSYNGKRIDHYSSPENAGFSYKHDTYIYISDDGTISNTKN